MPLKILITGTTGESMPPPYAGIPKGAILNARVFKGLGHEAAITFPYCPKNYDDFGVNAEYFFEYKGKPNRIKKIFFLLRYFFANPALYVDLFREYLRVDSYLNRETFLYPAYGVFLDGVFEKFKPDAVLSVAALIQSFMACQIAKRRNVPVVLDTLAEVHDLSMGANKHLSGEKRVKYWKTFLNLADIVMGDGNCAEGALTYVPEKTKVFHDSFDFNFYRMEIPESKEQLREQFKLPQNSFLVGAVGAFSPRKGHDYLIKAVAKLVKQGYDMGVVICGAGDPINWQKLTKEEGIEDKVYFFRNIKEDINVKLLRSLDLYTNLSASPRSCSWDMALLEGMASELPIVVFDYGDLPETVIDDKNGIVVPAKNVDATADAFLKIYKLSPEQRKEMGKAGLPFAAKADINIGAGQKLEWLKEAIKNRKK